MQQYVQEYETLRTIWENTKLVFSETQNSGLVVGLKYRDFNKSINHKVEGSTPTKHEEIDR